MEHKLTKLHQFLVEARSDQAQPSHVLERALQGKPELQETAALLRHKERIADQLLNLAAAFNQNKFQREIEFYAVSYISDFCINGCTYCGHSCLQKHRRSKLTAEKMQKDFSAVLRYGPGEICILAGEHPSITPEYLATAAAMTQKSDQHHRLERITFNVAPYSSDDFRKLRNLVNFPLQFRLFQESYDQKTYARHHLAGPKRDFLFRLGAQERALQAGFDHVGIGTLLGLNEEKHECEHDRGYNLGHDFEILALISHAYHLKEKTGKFPYSISLPRHQKVEGSVFSTPSPVDDRSYLLYHAILRLALPEVRIIVTNRETPELRDILRPMINIEDLATRPGVGGNYKSGTTFQNEFGDKRSSEEIIRDLTAKRYKTKTIV